MEYVADADVPRSTTRPVGLYHALVRPLCFASTIRVHGPALLDDDALPQFFVCDNRVGKRH